MVPVPVESTTVKSIDRFPVPEVLLRENIVWPLKGGGGRDSGNGIETTVYP